MGDLLTTCRQSRQVRAESPSRRCAVYRLCPKWFGAACNITGTSRIAWTSLSLRHVWHTNCRSIEMRNASYHRCLLVARVAIRPLPCSRAKSATIVLDSTDCGWPRRDRIRISKPVRLSCAGSPFSDTITAYRSHCSDRRQIAAPFAPGRPDGHAVQQLIDPSTAANTHL